MKKAAGFWLGGTVLFKKSLGAASHALLACSLLSACLQKDPDPVGPGGTGSEVGKAEINLPALPPGFLRKSAQSGDSSNPFFILTLSGPGMVTRKHAWPLSSAGGTTVTVEDIPVGSRLFIGQIEAGGGIVYADSVWIPIEPGRTALVRLRLARTTGNAKVCVEIEGLPPPTGCGGRDSLPDVSGCWSLNDPDPDPGDSARSAVLRILQQDTLLQGVVTWPDGGRRDTSRGYVTHSGHVSFGEAGGDFHFSGFYDRVNSALVGKFARNGGAPPSWEVRLPRTTCETVLSPVDSALTCYDAGQFLDGVHSTGRFAVLQQGFALYGHIQWNGYPGMPISGYAAPVGGNQGLYLYGNLPTGLARDSLISEGVHYKAQIVGGTLQYGTIHGTDGVQVQRGSWKGAQAACQPKDRATIRAVYGI